MYSVLIQNILQCYIHNKNGSDQLSLIAGTLLKCSRNKKSLHALHIVGIISVLIGRDRRLV